MANDIIQIGNKIEMCLLENRFQLGANKTPDVYVSQFFQWTDINVASIAIPTFKGQLVPLHIDELYELKFFTKSGLFSCRGKIIKKAKTSNNILIAEVKLITALEKIQRRQFYRMNCLIPMNYSVLNNEQKELYKEKKRCLSSEQKMQIESKLESLKMEYQKGIVLDISGGGMRFNSSVQQESDEVLLLQPAFPETVRKRIPFLFGRIISCRRIPNKEPSLYDNRVEFIEITSAEQEQIITYIFKEERDKRKRESEMK